MSQSHSDALVLFGAKGDLAFKKIFPALQSRVTRLRSTTLSRHLGGWHNPSPSDKEDFRVAAQVA